MPDLWMPDGARAAECRAEPLRARPLPGQQREVTVTSPPAAEAQPPPWSHGRGAPDAQSCPVSPVLLLLRTGPTPRTDPGSPSVSSGLWR